MDVWVGEFDMFSSIDSCGVVEGVLLAHRRLGGQLAVDDEDNDPPTTTQNHII